MIKKITTLFALLITLMISASASTVQTIDISTGIDINLPGNPILTVPGTSDPSWRLISTPNGTNLGAPKIPNFAVSPYFAWQKIAGTNYIFPNMMLSGNYEYERCFCLADPTDAKLTIELRADNQAQAFLNSYSNQIVNITANNSFGGVTAGRATVEKGFFPGRNCLRVRVNNESLITGMDAKIGVTGYGPRDTVDACCKEVRKPFADKPVQTDRAIIARVVDGRIKDQIDPVRIREAFTQATNRTETAVESEIVQDGQTWLLRVYSEATSGDRFRSATIPLTVQGAGNLVMLSGSRWSGCQSAELCIKQWCVSNSSGGCNCAVGSPGLCKRRVIDQLVPNRFFDAIRAFALVE